MSSKGEEDVNDAIELGLTWLTHPYVVITLMGITSLTTMPSLYSLFKYGGQVNQALGVSALLIGLYSTWDTFHKIKIIKNEKLLDPLLKPIFESTRQKRRKKRKR
jgi:hypothetical protein